MHERLQPLNSKWAKVFAAVAVLVQSGSGARGAECPFEPLDREKIVAALQSAKSCETSYALMNACRTNTSGDVEFADAVTGKCEATFLGVIDKKVLAAYAKDREACTKKYAGEHGTMYVSFAATCEAGVAVRYAKRWGKSAPTQ